MTVIPPFNIKTNHYNRTSRDVWQMMTKDDKRAFKYRPTHSFVWLTWLYCIIDSSSLYITVPFNNISKNWHCSNVNVVQTAQRILDKCSCKPARMSKLQGATVISPKSCIHIFYSIPVIESKFFECDGIGGGRERGGGWFGRIVWGCSGSWLVIVDMSSKHLWSYHKDGSHPGEWLIQPAISTIPPSWMPRPFLALGGWCSHLIQKWQNTLQ